MKIIFIVNLILLYSYISFSQTSYNNIDEKVLDKKHRIIIDTFIVKKYHKYINQAELAAINKKYKEAVALYDSSFNLPIIYFAQDIYNAALCSIELKDYNKSIYYCLKLVEKGFTKNFFEKKAFTSLKHNRKHWRGFLRKYYTSRETFLNKVDTSLAYKIKKMIVADQNYFCERPKHLDDNIFLDSLLNNDRYLSNQLSKLFDKYGYLTEEIIGANVSDTTFSIYPLFNVLVRHHYQLKQHDLSYLLYTAVLEGKLKPEIFCGWYNFEKKPVGYGDEFFIIKYNCNIYVSNYESIKAKIENNRKAMWLPTLEDLKKKIIYTYCLDPNRFAFYAPIDIIPPMDEKSEASFKLFNTLLPFKPFECK